MKSRTVALFPGAFRPPHANHFATLAALAADPTIDAVRVLISNRSRTLPGTTSVLGAAVAHDAWQLLLGQSFDNVTVEVAPDRAVAFCEEIVMAGQPGETFHLVVGREDHSTRTRFGKLRRLDLPSGVNVEVRAGAEDRTAFRATDVRRAVVSGDVGLFARAMPSEASEDVIEAIWRRCRTGYSSLHDERSGQIASVLEASSVPCGERLEIVPVSPQNPHTAYRIEIDGGRRLYAKCAADTIAAACSKPRNRAKVERAASRWVAKRSGGWVEVPTVLAYDKALATVVSSDPCQQGTPMVDPSIPVRTALRAAGAVGCFLGAVAGQPPPRPFREAIGDRQQWERVARTALCVESARPTVRRGVQEALEATLEAAVAGFGHLDLSAANVLVSDESAVAIIDYESASSWCDPMFDLAVFVASVPHLALEDAALVGYRRTGDPDGDAIARFRQLVAALRAVSRVA